MPNYKRIYHMTMDMEYNKLRIQKLTEELNDLINHDELILDEELDRMMSITQSIQHYIKQYEFLKRQVEEYL